MYVQHASHFSTPSNTMATLPLSTDNTIQFESCGGILQELDDGHIPESQSERGKFLCYESMRNDDTVSVQVFDNALSTDIVDSLYEATVAEGQPWGTYVTIEQVKEYWESRINDLSEVEKQSTEALSLHAVAHFVKTMASGQGATTTIPASYTTDCSKLLSSNDVHGVAVWALASDSTETLYHVDYAELLRYEQNVLVTPVWAGTLQCTSTPIKGGQFAVNLEGMKHYQYHGYKGNKSGDRMGGWKEPKDSASVDYNQETGWVTIPYRYNRMIGHSGHLPHLSAPFAFGEDSGAYRVVVGFNVFRCDVGPFVSQAPEHSRAFRRRIACHRALLHCNNKSVSLENIRQNKALTKLLVLAKREKVKADLRRAQERLDGDIETELMTNGSMSIEALTNRLARTDTGEWPSAIDVQVHIQRRIREGALLQSQDDESRIQLNAVADENN